MVAKRASSEAHPSAGPALDHEEQTVFDYLVKQNRPYSATDIFNNLHETVGRTSCTRALTSLSEKNLIHSKTWGRYTVFVARQDGLEAPTPEELAAMDAQIEDGKAQLACRQERIGALQHQLNTLTSAPTTDKLRDLARSLKRELEEKTARLQTLRVGGHKVDPAERDKVVKEGEALQKALASRRRLCMDIVGKVMEGAGESFGKKTAKEFMEEIGCEVD